jgi:hypothetical protein
MGFLTNMFSSVVKVAITPVAVVKDVVDVATGDDPKNTKKLLKSAVKDAEEGMDDLIGEGNGGVL